MYTSESVTQPASLTNCPQPIYISACNYMLKEGMQGSYTKDQIIPLFLFALHYLSKSKCSVKVLFSLHDSVRIKFDSWFIFFIFLTSAFFYQCGQSTIQKILCFPHHWIYSAMAKENILAELWVCSLNWMWWEKKINIFLLSAVSRCTTNINPGIYVRSHSGWNFVELSFEDEWKFWM